MMRLACVPLPAPGGPSRTTGPTSREVSCVISWPKPPEQSSAQPHTNLKIDRCAAVVLQITKSPDYQITKSAYDQFLRPRMRPLRGVKPS
jgi:hypothetical protein